MELRNGGNYVGQLQEYCMKSPWVGLPHYDDLGSTGNSNTPTFKMACRVGGARIVGELNGKKVALKQRLAFDMLQFLHNNNASQSAVNTGIELGSCLGSPPKKAKWGHESKIALQFARTLSFEGADEERTRGGTAIPLREVQIAMPNNPPGDALEDRSGEFDRFEGMSPTKNYAGDLNNYCQKNNLIYSCREVQRSGPPNRPTFVVQGALVRKNDPAKVLHTDELKMEKNIKTIKRYLDFLMCKKLGLGTGSAAPTETLDGELNNAQGEEDGDAQLEELRLVRETINNHMPKSKSPTMARRIPQEKKDFCKGSFVYTALGHLRNGTTGGKTSRQILNDIVQDEKRHGTASVRDFCITRKPPFQCMLSMKFHDSSFTFSGTGLSRPEGLEDAATKALTFLDKMLMPNIGIQI